MLIYQPPKHPFEIAEELDKYQRIIDRKFMDENDHLTQESIDKNLNESIIDNIFNS